MNISLYQAAAAMNNATEWQDAIAQNLAAGAVPGFKKTDLSFEAVQSGLYPIGRQTERPPMMLLPSATPMTSFAQGELRRDDLKTNLALQGPGFFTVQLPSSATAYTRDGQFTIDGQGQLVTKEGYPVLGEGGPIMLDLKLGSDFNITASGEVMQGNVSRGKLAITEFNDLQKLARLSAGYFSDTDNAQNAHAANATNVRQGFLEGANTSSVLEMANLMSAMRTFESNQRLVQLHDERMARSIQELGSPS
jgi:flagellar basal-body rod protein FlgG